MFAGEMDYTDIPINHWMGYVLFVVFVYLMVIVLMNLLNGLAVSDINKIQQEVGCTFNPIFVLGTGRGCTQMPYPLVVFLWLHPKML